MGPGSIEQAHTADEFIDINALEEGAAFFTRFIRSLA
jgi:acetylornithine deacetylase/succinyl-diaminopimelate desuccinylase-like protein